MTRTVAGSTLKSTRKLTQAVPPPKPPARITIAPNCSATDYAARILANKLLYIAMKASRSTYLTGMNLECRRYLKYIKISHCFSEQQLELLNIIFKRLLSYFIIIASDRFKQRKLHWSSDVKANDAAKRDQVLQQSSPDKKLSTSRANSTVAGSNAPIIYRNGRQTCIIVPLTTRRAMALPDPNTEDVDELLGWSNRQ